MAKRDERRIRLGLIGTGLAIEKLHWPALRQLSDRFVVTAFSDVSRRQAERFSRYSGVGMDAFIADHRVLLRRDDVDAVLIAVPIPHLYEIAEESLDAHKHVVCEKPTGINDDEARDFLALADRFPETVKMVAENYFYRDDIRYARALLDKGAIGKLHFMSWRQALRVVPRHGSFSGTTWRRRPRYRGGIHLDAGVHHIAQIRMLCGEIAQVHGATQWANSTMDAPSDLTLNLVFRGGAIGSYSALYTDIHIPPESGEMKLYGSEGVLVLGGTGQERRVILGCADGTAETAVFRGRDDGYVGELTNFADAVVHGEPIVGTIAQSYANMMVVLRALDSAEQGIVKTVELPARIGRVPRWRTAPVPTVVARGDDLGLVEADR